MSSKFSTCRYYTSFKWPYFRTAGGYGHMVGDTNNPIRILHTDVTLTWSMVKALTFWSSKSFFSMSTSSATLAWRSQLMGYYASMRPSLQFFAARFLNFSPVGGHVTSKFSKCWYHQNTLRFISAMAEAKRFRLWLQVGRNKPCTLMAMTVNPLVGLFAL